MAFRSLRLARYQPSCQCVVSKKLRKCGTQSLSKSGMTASDNYRSYSTGKSGPTLITTMEESKRFMKDVFMAVGATPENAEIVALNLLEADYRGHYSHGMNRVDRYVRDIQGGVIDVKSIPCIVKENEATAVLDGKNGFGSVVGKFAMELAIKKAKDVGIGLVVARASNHYGMAGMYTVQAVEQGLIGFSVTNTAPLCAPTGSKKATLGTNPIALGAPAKNSDSFLLDFATTGVALGKIEIAKRKGEPIPEGFALNDDGKPETNSAIAAKAMKLMPLGGIHPNAGHKGYGLGMLVEIFCGILSGSGYGHTLKQWDDVTAVANLGHAFMAIDPQLFAPGFEDRLQDLLTYLRDMEPVDCKNPVLVHGDKEKTHMKKVIKEGGFRYVENQHKMNKLLAEELNIKPMVSKSVTLC